MNDALALDCDAFPESDVVFDVGGGVLGLRIEPSGVFVARTVDDDVVVAGRAASFGIDVTLQLVGREACLRRIDRALEYIR